ncbi:ABC transporter ATP-binding protein [Methanomethylophilus alvi]|uniref:ABC transporter ATP-binding protein n=1 Tax=Methanomethylophilus alvi TaxID=1291540 RepID=UPI0037DCCCB9
MNPIHAGKLSKRYGELQAVDSLDLDVDGEIYGLLGPNGSGKTTTVNMLTTMLSITSGEASVCGYDVRTEAKRVRECISYIPQYIAADIRLTGRENVELFAELYGIRGRSERRRKAEECLEIMGLLDRADDITKSYSGGMNRRLEIAQALVHDPRVLFLDEPTVGLDVSGRRSIWEHILKLKRSGMTIFVTTHQMEEAEHYCNRVGIIRLGHKVNEGRPSDLTDSMGDVVTIGSDGDVPASLIGRAEILKQEDREVTLLPDDSLTLEEIIRVYEADGRKVFSTAKRRPTLEDVYLTSINKGTEDIGTLDRNQYRNMMRRR